MSWMTLAEVLVGWLLVGLGAAYLFGTFVRKLEPLESSDGPASPDASYERRAGSATTSPRTSSRAPVRARAPRAAGGRVRF